MGSRCSISCFNHRLEKIHNSRKSITFTSPLMRLLTSIIIPGRSFLVHTTALLLSSKKRPFLEWRPEYPVSHIHVTLYGYRVMGGKHVYLWQGFTCTIFWSMLHLQVKEAWDSPNIIKHIIVWWELGFQSRRNNRAKEITQPYLSRHFIPMPRLVESPMACRYVLVVCHFLFVHHFVWMSQSPTSMWVYSESQ